MIDILKNLQKGEANLSSLFDRREFRWGKECLFILACERVIFYRVQKDSDRNKIYSLDKDLMKKDFWAWKEKQKRYIPDYILKIVQDFCNA